MIPQRGDPRLRQCASRTSSEGTASFEELLAFGQDGELLVMELLIQRGLWVLPAFDYVSAHRRAPVLHGPDEQELTLPDLHAFGPNGPFWVEVKRKTEPMLYQKHDRLEHGIDRRHYDDYLAVGHITNLPVYLAIVEDSTGDVLIGLLDHLAENVRYYPEDGEPTRHAPMVNFAREDFELLAQDAQ